MQLFHGHFKLFLFRQCEGSSIALTTHMDTKDNMELCAFDELFKRNVPHVLEKIFLSLDSKSYMCCLDVNKSWKDLLTSEALIKRVLIYLSSLKNEEGRTKKIKNTAHMNTTGNRELCAFDKLFKRNVPHILEKIFLSLDTKSYMCCLDVNKSWKDLLTSEAMIKTVLIYLSSLKNGVSKSTLLSIPANTKKLIGNKF